MTIVRAQWALDNGTQVCYFLRGWDVATELSCLQGANSPKDDKTEVVLRRVEALLRTIIRESNHGEITIRVVRGRIYVTGGPETEIT